jgi:hypothetical protein
MARVGGFFTLLMAALIFGCAAVSSVAPVGERAKEISQNEWGGTWIHKSHSITIKVLNEQKGLLQVAWVEEKEGRQSQDRILSSCDTGIGRMNLRKR